MPIRPEFRHFYRTPQYRAARDRVMARAKNRCEQCKKPNRTNVFVLTMFEEPRCMFPLRRIQCWTGKGRRAWRDCYGRVRRDVKVKGLPRQIWVVCTVAHLNHTPGDDRDENLKFLCQWCHLHYDQMHHHETRAARKDATRPMLAAQEARA